MKRACSHVGTGISRRRFLRESCNGFGAVAFGALFGTSALAGRPGDGAKPMAARAPHHRARAKRMIFLYMDGGPSQVDTFDPKPRLEAEHGQPFKMKIEPTQFNDIGRTLKSPWKFRNYGESGIPVSDLFPRVGACADKLCVVRSMTSHFSEHTNANYFLHTGLGLVGRPSMGAWITYGLGAESEELPGFVVIDGGLIPPGGLECFGSGFLPASFQGSVFKPREQPIANVAPIEGDAARQRKKLALLGTLDAEVAQRIGPCDALESAISNYELAYRMQAAVPELTDLSGESEATKQLYGLDSDFEPTRIYGTQCLLARRLLERGVRFIELTCPRVSDSDRWDQHGRLQKNHAENARAVDQPIAALLKDLEARGLLEDTLVLWSGEFGRTPFAQGNDGRDHSPWGYSIWLAGGGVRAGHIHGATDEYGYHAVQGKVDMYDLHATLLHILGFDHTKLIVRHSGRDMRLTDVHGHVRHELLA